MKKQMLTYQILDLRVHLFFKSKNYSLSSDYVKLFPSVWLSEVVILHTYSDKVCEWKRWRKVFWKGQSDCKSKEQYEFVPHSKSLASTFCELRASTTSLFSGQGCVVSWWESWLWSQTTRVWITITTLTNCPLPYEIHSTLYSLSFHVHKKTG